MSERHCRKFTKNGSDTWLRTVKFTFGSEQMTLVSSNLTKFQELDCLFSVVKRYNHSWFPDTNQPPTTITRSHPYPILVDCFRKLLMANLDSRSDDRHKTEELVGIPNEPLGPPTLIFIIGT